MILADSITTAWQELGDLLAQPGTVQAHLVKTVQHPIRYAALTETQLLQHNRNNGETPIRVLMTLNPADYRNLNTALPK